MYGLVLFILTSKSVNGRTITNSFVQTNINNVKMLWENQDLFFLHVVNLIVH